MGFEPCSKHPELGDPSPTFSLRYPPVRPKPAPTHPPPGPPLLPTQPAHPRSSSAGSPHGPSTQEWRGPRGIWWGQRDMRKGLEGPGHSLGPGDSLGRRWSRLPAAENCPSGPCRGHLLNPKQSCGTPSHTGVLDSVPDAPPPGSQHPHSAVVGEQLTGREVERENRPVTRLPLPSPGLHPWSSPALSRWKAPRPWARWWGGKCWRTPGGPRNHHLLSAGSWRAAERTASWHRDGREGEPPPNAGRARDGSCHQSRGPQTGLQTSRGEGGRGAHPCVLFPFRKVPEQRVHSCTPSTQK